MIRYQTDNRPPAAQIAALFHVVPVTLLVENLSRIERMCAQSDISPRSTATENEED